MEPVDTTTEAEPTPTPTPAAAEEDCERAVSATFRIADGDHSRSKEYRAGSTCKSGD